MKDKYMSAMVEDMESLNKNHTREFVQLLKGKRVISCMWVFKRKLVVMEKKGNVKGSYCRKGAHQITVD